MGIRRLPALAVAALLLASCSGESRSDEESSDSGDGVDLGVRVDDPTQQDEVVLFDDGDRSVVLVDPTVTAEGREWNVRWTADGQSGTQLATFGEEVARCTADVLREAGDPFVAELRARGLDPGVGAGGTERLAVVDAVLGCDGGSELRDLAVVSLPDFDADCLGDLLVTDADFVELYGLQDPDASVDERRPGAERFGPCLDLLANTPDTFEVASTDCIRDAQSDLGTQMMLGADDFVVQLVDMFERCLTPEEFAALNLG